MAIDKAIDIVILSIILSFLKNTKDHANPGMKNTRIKPKIALIIAKRSKKGKKPGQDPAHKTLYKHEHTRDEDMDSLNLIFIFEPKGTSSSYFTFNTIF